MERVKAILNRLCRKVVALLRLFSKWTMRDGNPATDEKPPFRHCLNCGTELTGMYCHRCGQYATLPAQKMHIFVKEYFKNLFSLDRQAFPTLCNMIFHPGRVAREFSEGRHVSYLHPLKLNFFILVVLLTLFSFIGTDEKVQDSFNEIADEEIFNAEMILTYIDSNPEYCERVKSSPREEVKVILSKRYYDDRENITDYVEMVKVVSLDEVEFNDTLIMRVPSLLIEDKFLVERGGAYLFTSEYNDIEEQEYVSMVSKMWGSLTSIIFAHFPLFMLLTAPFLAFAIFLVLRRRGYSKEHYYIFALYYMAFVESLFLVIYIVGQFVELPSLKNPFLIAVLLYMAVSIREAFAVKSWIRAIISSVLINIIYFLGCMTTISLSALAMLIYYIVQGA